MEKAKRGRPPKAEHEKRTEYVRIRLTKSEKQRLEQLSKNTQATKTKTILKGLEELERSFENGI